MTAVFDAQTSKVTPLLQVLAERVEAADPSRYREITNAMTGNPLGRVPYCTCDDVVAAAERARAVQRRWVQRPIRERAEVMLLDLFRSHQATTPRR